MARVTHSRYLMPTEKDVSDESMAFDEAIRQLERHPPYGRHAQDLTDRALRLLDAMMRAGFSHSDISDYFKARVLIVSDPEAREAVAGACARAMTTGFPRKGNHAGSGKDLVRGPSA